MAEKTYIIKQQTTKPIKITKWKVKEGTTISIGRVIMMYEPGGDVKKEQLKFKSTRAGTIRKFCCKEGDVVEPDKPLLEIAACIHPTVMKDMCAECGADLRKDDTNTTTASVPMVHSVPELKVSEEVAQKLGRADGERLLRDRKLVLLVDLDQTLIHTTNDNIPANLKDVYHFQLYGRNSPWYHTRLRPGTHEFLANVAPYFELHICTFGARNYAHMIATFLDRDGNLFSHRILSRDECFDPTSKTANLKALFPCGDNMVCIIDDREDVWSHASNLIHVKPYHFFQHTGDINAPPGLDKLENDKQGGVDFNNIVKKEKKKKEELNGGEDQNTNETKNNESKSKDENNEPEDAQQDKETTENEKMDLDNTEEKNNVSKEEEIVENSKETLVNSESSEKTESESKKQEESETELGESKSENMNTSSTEKSETDDSIATKAEESKLETESNNQKKEVKEEQLENKSDELPQLDDNEPKEQNSQPPQVDQNDSDADKSIVEKSSKEDDLIEVEDPDDYLLYLEDILKSIHKAFYDCYDKMESGEVPDLKKVIPSVRSKVLTGTKLVFSGLVPTHVKLEQSRAYQVARSLGAIVTQDLETDTTHLVAVRPGTAKVNAGRRKKNLKIVTPDWLWACAECWLKVEEKLYPLNSKGSKNRHPPAHCSSPEPASANNVDNLGTPSRKRTSSGRFMDTINPLMSFSSADIEDMDREVEDIFNESESDSEATAGGGESQKSRRAIIRQLSKDSDDESSSSVESLTAELPRGFKRSRKKSSETREDDSATENNSLDETPSVKFRRGERLESDLDFGQDSNSDGSMEPDDEVDDGEWNMMGAALEREFLANN